jgi:hypothetical protein
MFLAGRLIYVRGGCDTAGYDIVFYDDFNAFPGYAGTDGSPEGIR